jgi:hypothetical protein
MLNKTLVNGNYDICNLVDLNMNKTKFILLISIFMAFFPFSITTGKALTQEEFDTMNDEQKISTWRQAIETVNNQSSVKDPHDMRTLERILDHCFTSVDEINAGVNPVQELVNAGLISKHYENHNCVNIGNEKVYFEYLGQARDHQFRNLTNASH